MILAIGVFSNNTTGVRDTDWVWEISSPEFQYVFKKFI